MILRWIAGIVVFLLLLAFFSGWFLLDFTCGRRKQPDPLEEKTIHDRGFDWFKDQILAGKAWLEGKEKEELSITSHDGLTLRALFVPNPAAKGTLLLFHGWRSSWKTDFIVSLPFYYEQDMNLLLVDQRAQNSSEGHYMTYGVLEHRDAGAWVECMAKRLGREHPLFLGGLSMGASTVLMASDLEFDANVRGIIADCGFTSPREIIRCVASRNKWIPLDLSTVLLEFFARRFAGFSLTEKSTVDALRRTKLPVLLFHGIADTFVPPEMSRENYEACASEKEMLLVEGATHGMSYVVAPEKVKAMIAAFFQKHLSSAETGAGT